jgi:hypothetical protein
MKSLTKLYLVLVVIFYVNLLANSISNLDQWRDVQTCLQWFINALGLFALVSYSFSLETFTYVRTQKRWMIVLILMLSFYAHQFYSSDFFPPALMMRKEKLFCLTIFS